MCVNTHSLKWIQFPLWTLIDSFVWIGIVHGIHFDISGWYHGKWWILYICKVIKGNACAYLGLLGVACSPILSASLEEVDCEPVLNLAATPDEAVSIICKFVDKTRPSTFWGKVDVCELYYWPARVFSRASCRCSSLNLSVSSLTWLTYASKDALSRWHCSWRVLTLQCACQFFGLCTSTHVCSQSIPDCYIIKRHGGHAWYGCWTIKALVEAEVLYDGFYCESRVHSSAVDHSKIFSCLIINK